MTSSGKIPATVITGFLGAGKTSTIRHLLANAGGKRLALIINEFGDLGVDGEIIKGCGIEGCDEEDVLELANGCICCTVADDFLPTIQGLLDRPEPPDHIVIETSGLALPKPLIKAFNWPEVRTRVTVDGVIAVVDAPAVAEGLFAGDPERVQAQREADEALDHESPLEELFEEQLASADMVVLNKADLVEEAAMGGVRTSVDAELRPGVRVVKASHGAVDPLDHESPLEELFEEQLASADMVVLNKADLVEEAAMGGVRTSVDAELRPGVRVVKASHGAVDPLVLLGLAAAAEDDLDSRHSHHDEAGEHDHDDFESFSLPLGELAAPETLLDRLHPLIEAHGILRIKGFAAVAGKEMRLVTQGVGRRLQHYYDRPWQDGETRRGQLVVIGERGLDQAAIRAALAF